MSNTDQLLSEAKEQLANLPHIRDLAALVLHQKSHSHIEYLMENMAAGCFGYPLYNNGAIAVQLVNMKAGAVFPRHTHNSREWLLLYGGKIQFFNGKYQGQVYNINECVEVLPKISHRVKALEDSWMLAITIPADKGYPK